MDLDAELAARESSLLEQLATVTKAPEEMGSISFGKRVGEGTAMAVDRISAVATQETLMAKLADVRHARKRLAEGSYGTCEVCGTTIPPGRLEARPETSRCVEHA